MYVMAVIASWPAAVTWAMIWGYLAGYGWMLTWEGVPIAWFLLKVVKTKFLLPPPGYSFIVLLLLLLLDFLRGSGFLGNWVVHFYLLEGCTISLWAVLRTGSFEMCRACLTCSCWFWRVSYSHLCIVYPVFSCPYCRKVLPKERNEARITS